MRIIINRSVVGLIFALLMWGCYPAGPEYVEDLDLVYTSFDKDFDFKTRKTYAMPDKIVVDVTIKINGDTVPVYMNDIFAKQILGSIDKNMKDYGWTKVDISGKPDVLVAPAAFKNTSYYYSYWYDWWYGGFYPGWGWYYPPYYTISSYSTGTLIITIMDPNVIDDSPINESEAAWVSAANGLLSGTYNNARVLLGINQAFIQSPYLKIN